MAERVTVFEVGPRDGLQNESRFVKTEDKIRLIDALAGCGLRKIEAASFVDPRRVPQMADGAAVMAGIERRPGVRYAALVPNARGYDAARSARADEVAVFASASEGFSRRNINCSIAESLDRFQPVLTAAARDGVPVRGYVSCVAECPYDGPTPPRRAAEVAAALLAMGCYEVSLGDTLGAAEPEAVERLLDAVLERLPPARLAAHFHDTRGRALDNLDVCISRGIRTVDASVGGLGGCPFAPGSAGNVATEAVVDLLHRKGWDTGIDADGLASVAAYAKSLRSAS